MSTALELLQWALLFVLGFMVLGLTRQLAYFLVPHAQQLKQEAPEPGQRLPAGLVAAREADLLVDHLERAGAERAGVLIVDEGCVGCQRAVEILESMDKGDQQLPLVAIAKRSGSAFVDRLRQTFDLVIEDPDGEKCARAGFVVTPSALLCDRQLTIVDIELGTAAPQVINTWHNTPEPEALPDVAPITVLQEG